MQSREKKLKGEFSFGRFRDVIKSLKRQLHDDFQASLIGQKRIAPITSTKKFWYGYRSEINRAWMNAEHRKSEALIEWQRRNVMRMR